MFFFVVIKHQVLFHTWDSSYYINIQNATIVYENQVYSLSYVSKWSLAAGRGVVPEDYPTRGKLLTIPTPQSLKIHELMTEAIKRPQNR